MHGRGVYTWKDGRKYVIIFIFNFKKKFNIFYKLGWRILI